MNPLTEHATLLKQSYPVLASQINNGLVLALSGKVSPIELDPTQGTAVYTVGSEDTRYTVKITGVPRRWGCNCKQGREYGPIIGEFLGHPGRICKHIVAAGLCYLVGDRYPEPARSVLEIVTRLVQAEAIDGDSIDLPTGHGIKLERWGSGIVLKAGRVKSESLAYQVDGSGWAMVEGVEALYADWVAKVKEADKDEDRATSQG